MPADFPGLTNVLRGVFSQANLAQRARERLACNIVGSFLSAVGAGRAPDKVTILLLGGTGQGKSKTINKLVGRDNFLKTGRNESTTTDIQSVLIPIVRDNIKVILALDDTPGLLDTTLANREKNAETLRKYCLSFTPTKNTANAEEVTSLLDTIHSSHPAPPFKHLARNAVFPNAILLTSTWADVKNDAQNEPGGYTSALGQAIWLLHTSRLFDEERPNVIVVVTKALADPQQWMDEDEDWMREAQVKREIVHAIQEAVYPGSSPWPIVFVENGGKSSEFPIYPTLPNQEQSHQNLIDELHHLFRQTGKNGAQDLLGLQVLGDMVSGLLGQPERDIQIVTGVRVDEQTNVPEVVPQTAIKLSGAENDLGAPPQSATLAVDDALALTILGHTYNPVRNQVGAKSIIGTESKVKITPLGKDGFDKVCKPERSTTEMCATQSQLSFKGHIRMALTAVGPESQYVAFKTVAKAVLDGPSPILSPEMLDVVKDLPPWDEMSSSALKDYYKFFDNHGTHVVISAAFGGAVYLKGREESRLDPAVVEAALQSGLLSQPSDTQTNKERVGDHRAGEEASQGVRFMYQGGREAGTSLIDGLQQLFDRTSPPPVPAEWQAVCSRWANELQQEPVFLSPSPETAYVWVHSLRGLSSQQAHYLEQAAHRYLTKPMDKVLDRSSNVAKVRRALKEGRLQLRTVLDRVRQIFAPPRGRNTTLS